MKTRMFRVLCVVLALALLSSNVFAATPTPEVPLADEATVTRVKNEIATGQITDMEDVFLVAYQHLGADLEEEGLTTYINPDGTLGITQIIKSNSNTRNGGAEGILSVTSILPIDHNGQPMNAEQLVYSSFPQHGYGSLDSAMMYATNTINIAIRMDGFVMLDIRLSSVKTTITYGSTAFSASRLTQSFESRQAEDAPCNTGSQSLDINSAGTYTYLVGGDIWRNPLTGNQGGYIKGTATIYVANSNLNFTVTAKHNFTWTLENYIDWLS